MKAIIAHAKTHFSVAQMGWGLAILWTVVIVLLLFFALYNNYAFTLTLAQAEARTNFNKDLIFRHWVTEHGGVYVPVTEDTLPNPYLDIPERDITTPSGRQLTLLNPAYATRQLYELGKGLYDMYAHITSLNPIRPENAPDEWETQALQRFELGEREYSSVETFNDQTVLRYMSALTTEQKCLTCHEIQGYQVGDVRGGISIVIPLAPYWSTHQHNVFNILLGHLAVWGIGLVGVAFSTVSIQRMYQRELEVIQQLRASELRYRALFEQSNDAVFIIDLEGNIQHVNWRASKLLGYSIEQIALAPAHRFLIHNELEDAQHVFDRVRAGESVTPYERTFVHQNGTPISTEVSVQLVYDEAGRPLHIQSVVRDISRRKQIERDLQDKYSELERFFAVSLDMLCIADTQGRFLRVNQAFERILGYPVSAIEGQQFLDFVHPDDIQPTIDITGQLDQQQIIIGFVNRYRTADGTYRFIEWRSNPYGNLLYGAGRDITERYQIEKQLRQSEERYRLTLQSTHAGTWEWKVKTGETIFNERWAEMIGYRLDDLMPVNIDTWLNLAHPDDLARSQQLLEQHFRGESTYYECEARMKHKEGHWVWILDRGMVLERDEDGNPLRMFGIHMDISERKKVQSHEIELALEKERHRILTHFIQNVTHEFRTPLSVIGSSAYLLSRTDDIHKRQAKVDLIEQQIWRITRLVDVLLVMAKLESNTKPEQQSIYVKDIVQAAVYDIKIKYPMHTRLSYEVAEDLPKVIGSAEEITEALKQVLDNACRFTPYEGTVILRVRYEGNHCIFEISDTGKGIAPTALPYVFDTFWRLDDAHTSQGLGLGLTIVNKIIQRHAGRIEIDSRINEGTLFSIFLPIQPTGLRPQRPSDNLQRMLDA